MKHLSRFPVGSLAAFFVIATVVPLALLTYLSLTLSSDAVRREAERRMSSSAALSAEVVEEEMSGLSQLVQSYANRLTLRSALDKSGRTPADARSVRHHLQELRSTQDGVYTTFVASPTGKLIDIVPATPSIVGRNFAFRDWYKGVTRTGGPFISEAYRTQAAGQPIVVAAASPVREPETGRMLGILVAAYSLDHIQELVNGFARAQGVKLRVTDRRGVLLAEPGVDVRKLVSHFGDSRVRAALLGRSGVREVGARDGRSLSAYAPVPEIGWTVTASVPTSTAFAAISDLRSTVLTIAALLALVLLGGLLLLVRALISRHRAEDEARRFASINRAVLDATPAGILLVDQEGRRLVQNEAMRQVSEADAVPGETIYEDAERRAERVADPQGFRWAMSEVASDPERETSIEIDAKDGRSFNLYTAPVRESPDSILGRIFVLRDQTAEREAERLKSELVATVSHELRTPLASILGFAELLSERELPAPVRETYVSTIYNEAKRLTGLINDFLDLQRIEAGSFTLSLEPFDLAELLASKVELFSHQSDRHTIEIHAPDGMLEVLGDRDRVGQVLGNLISNAIKYSPQGGEIGVNAENAPHGVRISIRDHGLGIPADQQRMLFTKFFRVDTSDTREIGGTGLGLALCREIVEAHGGRIGFDSIEGEGSTFWFQLPATIPGETAPGRILVVEDDASAARLLADYLEADGHTVEVVAAGEQALDRTTADPPAAICLDVALSGQMDGWQVLARLKASPATAHVPVIICSGRNGREHAAALGAADYLAKPFTQEQIRNAIERILPLAKGSILVVDDDESVRRLVRESLRGNGFEMREAADGEDALDKISERRPDAVVLDLIMPGLDGFAVLEQLQADAETRLLPVIVLTAKRLTKEERQRLHEGTVALLEKSSYSATELRRLVRRAIPE